MVDVVRAVVVKHPAMVLQQRLPVAAAAVVLVAAPDAKDLAEHAWGPVAFSVQKQRYRIRS